MTGIFVWLGRIKYKRMKASQNIKKSITVFIILIAFIFSAMAQNSGTEKDNNSVWQLQAKTVAESYGLNEKEATKLSKAYVSMRMNVVEQNKEVDRKADPEAYKANAAKNELIGQNQIKKSIGKILKSEQVEEALLLLGSFNSRWDTYQKVLIDLDLNDTELSSSSIALVEYMKNYLLARKLASDSGERFSGRTASELKSKLDKALSENLDPAKLAQWETATQRKAKSN